MQSCLCRAARRRTGVAGGEHAAEARALEVAHPRRRGQQRAVQQQRVLHQREDLRVGFARRQRATRRQGAARRQGARGRRLGAGAPRRAVGACLASRSRRRTQGRATVPIRSSTPLLRAAPEIKGSRCQIFRALLGVTRDRQEPATGLKDRPASIDSFVRARRFSTCPRRRQRSSGVARAAMSTSAFAPTPARRTTASTTVTRNRHSHTYAAGRAQRASRHARAPPAARRGWRHALEVVSVCSGNVGSKTSLCMLLRGALALNSPHACITGSRKPGRRPGGSQRGRRPCTQRPLGGALLRRRQRLMPTRDC